MGATRPEDNGKDGVGVDCEKGRLNWQELNNRAMITIIVDILSFISASPHELWKGLRLFYSKVEIVRLNCDDRLKPNYFARKCTRPEPPKAKIAAPKKVTMAVVQM